MNKIKLKTGDDRQIMSVKLTIDEAIEFLNNDLFGFEPGDIVEIKYPCNGFIRCSSPTHGGRIYKIED